MSSEARCGDEINVVNNANFKARHAGLSRVCVTRFLRMPNCRLAWGTGPLARGSLIVIFAGQVVWFLLVASLMFLQCGPFAKDAV